MFLENSSANKVRKKEKKGKTKKEKHVHLKMFKPRQRYEAKVKEVQAIINRFFKPI